MDAIIFYTTYAIKGTWSKWVFSTTIDISMIRKQGISGNSIEWFLFGTLISHKFYSEKKKKQKKTGL